MYTRDCASFNVMPCATSAEHRRSARPIPAEPAPRNRYFSSLSFLPYRFCWIFRLVDVATNERDHVSGSLDAGKARIEHELCHTCRRLDLGLKNIRLQRVQKALLEPDFIPMPRLSAHEVKIAELERMVGKLTMELSANLCEARATGGALQFALSSVGYAGSKFYTAGWNFTSHPLAE
jgi:hypothetical protein